MLKFLKKYLAFLLLITVIFSSYVLISYHYKKKDIVPFGQITVDMAAPFQHMFLTLFEGINGIWEGYVNLIFVKSENEKLKKDFSVLNYKIIELGEVKKENERLKSLLELKSASEYDTIAARVVGVNPSNWFRTITVDKGKNEGILKNMTVFTHNGLAGRVVETSLNTAKVLLIIDHNSAVSTVSQRTRAMGILEGKLEGSLNLKYVRRTSDIGQGDVLVTSGLGGIFPKGIPVGRISNIDKKGAGMFQAIEVLPFVDFSNLEEVLVIKEVFKMETSGSSEKPK